MRPTFERRPLGGHIRGLPAGESVWSDFQAMATPCTQPGPRELWGSRGGSPPEAEEWPRCQKAVGDVQSKPTLGLAFVHWYTVICQGAASRALPCRVCERELPGQERRSSVCICGSIPPVKRMPLDAKAGSSTHEDAFGMSGKQGKAPAHQWGQGRIGQPGACLPRLTLRRGLAGEEARLAFRGTRAVCGWCSLDEEKGICLEGASSLRGCGVCETATRH